MRTIKIFLGGGVQLLHGNESLRGYRNDVIDPVVSQLNAVDASNSCYIAKDYSDLTRNVVKGSQQKVYNRFIVNEADVAIFIINGEIGNITKHEIDCAVESTKKRNHPLVFIYGTNVKENDEILDYLNQEGIYYQHFYDNRDLAAKIKADLQYVASHLSRTKRRRLLVFAAIFAVAVAISAILYSIWLTSNPKVNGDCVAQLYLMRYKDINYLAGEDLFTEPYLSQFRYEDSIISRNSIRVFPLIASDSIVHTTNPILRIKLHNKNRNTVVLVSADLEVDSLMRDPISQTNRFIPLDINATEIPQINISADKQEYPLVGFRHNVAYGETDDRYYFSLSAPYSCKFRVRVKAKTQLGDFLSGQEHEI